ncbi:hypothetical protein Tco_0003269 [Tanacetum coccineum]
MLWGIITQTNVDHAELLWEEFTQGIQTFFSHKASHKDSAEGPRRKLTPSSIPYGRFSKVIIYYLASNNNIHRRPDSAVHHTGDDFILGNLKFVPKGETVEVFGMAIPDPLITEAIQQSSYYLISGNESIPQEKVDDPDLELAKKNEFGKHIMKRRSQEEKELRDLVYLVRRDSKLLMISTTGHSSQPEDVHISEVIHESSSTSDQG